MGIPTYIDRAHAIAHDKTIVIDNSILVTGSFNFSKVAEYSNSENLLVIRDNPSLIASYMRNYEEHKRHSEIYSKKPGTQKIKDKKRDLLDSILEFRIPK